MPYPKNPLDPNDPDYDPVLDPHNSQYNPNDPRLVGGVSPYVSGRSMSKGEADQYLAARRAKTAPAASRDMSTDEADAYLKQFRGKQRDTPQQVAGDQTATPPPITGEQPIAPAENPALAAFHAMPPIVQQHPFLAGLGALAGGTLASALIPEGAAAATLGVLGRQVVAPVARWGLGLAGLDWLSGGRLHETLAPRLVDLLTRGLEEGGGGSAP